MIGTPQYRHILVTGGAGFIGSHFVRWTLDHRPQVRVTNLDALTYAGNLESLEDVLEAHGESGDRRYRFIRGDIRDLALLATLLKESDPPIDAIVHFAAESHVDRSLMGPAVFVETNVLGTLTLLEACRAEVEGGGRVLRFVHVSTDEVYGSLRPTDPPFTEATPVAPNSPYSATKAGADLLVRAYIETFQFPAIITRCSNNYGPYQFPEKLIPLMITRALRDEPLPVYGDGRNVRDWIYVEDHVEAISTVLDRAPVGSVYNIGGEVQVENVTIVRHLLALLGKPDSLIRYVTDRPGHDRRYAMDISRIRHELGWSPRWRLEDGLRTTLNWYLAHRQWWERVLSEAYRAASALYISGS